MHEHSSTNGVEMPSQHGASHEAASGLMAKKSEGGTESSSQTANRRWYSHTILYRRKSIYLKAQIVCVTMSWMPCRFTK